MRLWSIHPKYLDRQGLLAVWREGLLAQSILLKGEYTECPRCEVAKWGLIHKVKDNIGYNDCPKCKGTGKIKTPYWNHPQLDRFKRPDSFLIIGMYLVYIWAEANKREYKFDRNKISNVSLAYTIENSKPLIDLTVTKGQLKYEFEHLSRKLITRDYNKGYINEMNTEWKRKNIQAHPLFKVVEGDIESWEKIK